MPAILNMNRAGEVSPALRPLFAASAAPSTGVPPP